MEIKLPVNISVPVSKGDPSQRGHARRQALSLANQMGLSEQCQGQLALIVTEAAANIATHGEAGEVVLIPWQFRGDCGIDVLALDKGKGIADIGRAMEDGYSTAGTAGEGLGAMSRLAHNFQLYSGAGRGTALLARVVRETPSSEQSANDYAMGAISLPIAGETQCGDAWSAHFAATRSIYMVADGLGHGPAAAEASREAIRVFEEEPLLPPLRILAKAHLALAKTRGAAISIAEILHDQSLINFAGVGNVAGVICDQGKTRSMVTMNGTVGHALGRTQSFSYPWGKTSLLIMHSDGLGTRWNMDQYPGLSARHATLLAGVLYRDFCRKRDDVTILVSRV